MAAFSTSIIQKPTSLQSIPYTRSFLLFRLHKWNGILRLCWVPNNIFHSNRLETNPFAKEILSKTRIIFHSLLCKGIPTFFFFFFFSFTVECVSLYWVGWLESESEAWYPSIIVMESGNNKTWTQNQYGGNVGGCCSKIKTAWEKRINHRNSYAPLKWLKNVINFFFFFENAKIWVARTTLNGEKKGDGLTGKKCQIESQFWLSREWK